MGAFADGIVPLLYSGVFLPLRLSYNLPRNVRNQLMIGE